MISIRIKYFSMLMAVIMLATSVGITAKVHYCFMEYENPTTSKTEKCCDNDKAQSCCDTIETKSGAADLVTDNSCCQDEIKSFAFASEFTNKFFSIQLTQFVALLNYTSFYHFTDVSEQNYLVVATVFLPPKLYGTALLNFKQVWNL